MASFPHFRLFSALRRHCSLIHGVTASRRTPRLLLAGLILLSVPLAEGLRAQDTTQSPPPLSEGYAVHHPTETLYFYRIAPDSTVYLRKGKSPKSKFTITIPAQTLDAIHKRVDKQVGPPEQRQSRLALGYEDQYVILQFNQRFDLYVLGTLVLVVVLGAILFWWLWRRLSRERRRRETIARSRRFLAEGREKERERLSQEIHDGPVQDLHGLHMQLKSLDTQKNGAKIEETGTELMRVTRELRAMSADLHPPALQRFGLPAALRSHADRLRERYDDVTIEMNVDADCPSFPETFALSLFRVAQESTNNAVQHGNATNIRVNLECEGPTVVLEIRDNGGGFAPPEDLHDLADQDHYGLLGMQERADAIGATLDIDSTPGEGTCIRLRGSTDAPTPANDHGHAPAPA